MSKNYVISKSGFTIVDSETQHSLEVKFENDKYQGNVSMMEQDIRLPLAPWKKGENPFQDNNCFEGSGNHPTGLWWFTIRPSSTFTQIMSEVEALNKKSWKFWEKRKDTEASLSLATLKGHKYAHDICMSVKNMEVILQLVLEDIEGASMGSDLSKAFARNSGISPQQYTGALNNSRAEVDGPKGVKTFLDEVTMGMLPDRDKMVEFRLAVTDYIMRYHKLGKYSK